MRRLLQTATVPARIKAFDLNRVCLSETFLYYSLPTDHQVIN